MRNTQDIIAKYNLTQQGTDAETIDKHIDLLQNQLVVSESTHDEIIMLALALNDQLGLKVEVNDFFEAAVVILQKVMQKTAELQFPRVLMLG